MTPDDHLIDNRVREVFTEYESQPPGHVWNRLEQTLSIRRMQQARIRRTWMLGAAALLLAFVTGYYTALHIIQPSTLIQPSMTADLQPPVAKGRQQSLTSSPGTGIQPVAVGESKAGNLPSFSTDYSRMANEPTRDLFTETSFIEPAQVAWSEEYYMPDLLIPRHDIIKLQDFLPPQIPSLVIPVKKKHQDERWSIACAAGQTYSNYYNTGTSVTDGSEYDHTLLGSTKDQLNRPMVSATMTVDYSFSKRIGLSTGLSYHQFSTQLISEAGSVATLSSNKPVISPFGDISFNSEIRGNLAKSPLLEINSGQFEQHFSYLEFPVTGRFLIIDRQVGLAVKAGVGANLLTANQVFLIEDEESSQVGQTKGLRDLYLSGIMGMEIYIKLHPRLLLSFNPVYRHALQPVSSESSSDPHLLSLGLYSGLQYQF